MNLPRVIIRILIVIILVAGLVHLLWDDPPPNDADLRLVPLNIPRDENAFTWFVEAGQKMPLDTEKDLERFYGCGVDAADAIARESELAEEIVHKNAEAIDLVKMGLAFTRIESLLPERYPHKAPHLAQWSRLARVMSLRAIAHSRADGDRDAMDDVLDTVAFGQMAAKCRGGSLHYLRGIAIKQIGYHALSEILPDVELPPDALMEYAGRLAALAVDDEALANAFRADYMSETQSVDNLLDGELVVDGKRVPKFGRNIMLLRNATKRLQADIHRTAIRNVGRRPDQYEVSRAELESKKPHRAIPFLHRNMIGRMNASLAPSLERICRQGLAIRANDSMARLLIAIRCHHMKAGALPASLNELVPAWIDAVPLDPFDAEPIRYDPARKIIYSIGTDCEDNGGDEEKDAVVKIEF